MKQTVYLDDFRQAFHNMDRGNQFSYEGLELLYDYLEECDEDMELDVIALCCDFSECSLDEFLDAFPDVVEADSDYFSNDEDKIQAIEDYIQYNGGWYSIIGNHSVIFSNF
jgi:antirestriction protein